MAGDNRDPHPAANDPGRERRRSLVVKIVVTAVVAVIAVGVGVWVIVSNDDGDSTALAPSGQFATQTPSSAAGQPGNGPSGPGAGGPGAGGSGAGGSGAGGSGAGGSGSSGGSGGSSTTPSVVTDTGAFRVTGARSSATATVRIFEDFQCPVCREFESQFGGALSTIRSDPKVAVDYVPVAILDRLSSTRYSTRAANASACVAEATAGSGDYSIWLKFHQALYAQQPPEQSAGLTNDELTGIAGDAGTPGSVSTCIANGQYDDWTTSLTENAIRNGLQGTPQVELNGTMLELTSPDALVAAVEAATA